MVDAVCCSVELRICRKRHEAVDDSREQRANAILPYPLQNQLTRPMRQAAAAKGDAGLLSLWAGQGVSSIRAMPAADLVRVLASELAAAPHGGPQPRSLDT